MLTLGDAKHIRQRMVLRMYTFMPRKSILPMVSEYAVEFRSRYL
jgi:hypothetical protein